MERAIELEHVKPNRYRVSFEGKEIGVWKDPEHAAARRLIELSLAAREDALLTFRDKILCMRGNLGWFADHATADDERGVRTVKWRPFPAQRRRSGSALDDPEEE